MYPAFAPNAVMSFAQPITPVPRSTRRMSHSEDLNYVLFFMVNEQERKSMKQKSSGTSAVCWPSVGGFGNQAHRAIDFANESIGSRSAPLRIPKSSLTQFFDRARMKFNETMRHPSRPLFFSGPRARELLELFPIPALPAAARSQHPTQLRLPLPAHHPDS